jgi:tetratricopeptide (TPR) repeat protein
MVPLARSLVLLLALAAPAQIPVGELIDRARTELGAKRYAQASDLLESVLRRAPEREDAARMLAVACSHLGVEAHDRGDLEVAGRRFGRAVELFPEDPALLQSLGTVRLRQGLADDAHRIMTRVLELDPQSVEAHVVLARVAADRGDFAVARDHFAAAARLAPGRPDLEQALLRFERDAEVEAGFISTLHGDFTVQRRRGGPADGAVRTVLAVLQAAYAELKRNLGAAPAGPIQVVLYTDEEYRRVNTTGHWAGAWFDGRLRVSIGSFPREQLRLRQALRHELCHAFLHSLFPGTPLWLHEGYAQVFEGKSPEDAQQKLRQLDDRWLEPEMLLQGFNQSRDELVIRLGYEESLATVGWLLRHEAPAKFRELLARTSSGMHSDAALRLVYRRSLEELRVEVRR